MFWACSSVVERYVDIVEAISSILIMPTKTFLISILLTVYFNKYNHYKTPAW